MLYGEVFFRRSTTRWPDLRSPARMSCGECPAESLDMVASVGIQRLREVKRSAEVLNATAAARMLESCETRRKSRCASEVQG